MKLKQKKDLFFNYQLAKAELQEMEGNNKEKIYCSSALAN